MKKLLFLLLFAIPLYGQGVRFESNVVQSATVAGVPNVLTAVSTAAINICTFPASGVPCVNKAATYTSATLTTPCSTAQQLVLPGTTNCVSNTDAQGNWGVWVAAGTYSYTVTIAGVNLGPYTFSVGGAGGGSSISLQTNGVTNPVQNVLNIKQGAGITAASDGAGGVTIGNSAPAPTLQTNGTTNATQNKLNLVAGSNITLSDDTLGDISIVATGGGGGSSTVGTVGQVQKTDGAGGHVASAITDNGTTTTVNDDLATCGKNPWFDIRCYGARSPTFSTTASCVGTTAITLASASSFHNGDGIVIYGCGANVSVTAPAAPTVVSGQTKTEMVPDAVLSAATGGNTFIYSGVARDQFGGMSVAGSATTITNGLTLGPITTSVTNAVLSGNTMTFTTSPASGIQTGVLFHYTGGSNGIFTGRFQVSSVTDGTHFVATVPFTAPASAPITVTGGQIVYTNGNQVTFTLPSNTWQIYLCARRPGDGSAHVISATTPNNVPGEGLDQTTMTDWGSPQTTAPTLPPYVTDSICTAGSPTNDFLQTHIVSGAGSTNIVVADTASQTASGQSAYFDNGYAIAAASAAASAANGGTVYIPLGLWHVYSQRTLSAQQGKILMAGNLAPHETIVSNGYNWQGLPTYGPQGGAFQFSWQGATGFWCMGAWPCTVIASTGSVNFNNIAWYNSGNQAILTLVDTLKNVSFDNCTWATPNTAVDYTSIQTYFHGVSYGEAFHHPNWVGGPGTSGYEDTTTTPMVLFDRDPSSGLSTAGIVIDFPQSSPRSITQISGSADAGGMLINNLHAQGALTPGVTFDTICCGFTPNKAQLSNFIMDTTYEPWYAIYGAASNGPMVFGLQAFAVDTHGFPLPFTGITQAAPVFSPAFTYPPADPQPLPNVNAGVTIVGNGYTATINPGQLSANRTAILPDAGTSGSPAVIPGLTGTITSGSAICTSGTAGAAVTAGCGNAWYPSLDPTAGDICAKINHIALTLMPSTGGVIDADGLGSQACATNPWASVGSKGIKFTSVGTQFLTTAQWFFPPSFAWDCGVQGSATRGCSIVAQTGFPTGGAAVLEYGTALIAQSIHVSGLTVDCNNIANTIGIEDQYAQEGAYANDVTINNCASIGLNLIGTGGGAQNSGNWERINVQTGTSAGANTLCIKMNQVPSAIEVTRYTCNVTTNSGTAPNYGIQIDGGGFLTDGQVQSTAVAGVVVGFNAASSSGTKINGLKVNGSTPTGVLLSSAFNVQRVKLFGIQGAATNNLVDQQTFCSSGTSALGFYDLGSNDSSGNYVRVSGSNTAGCGVHIGYLGLYTVGLQEATNPYSANHTITTTEGNVIVTATSTMTLPHASVGNIWNVFCKSGTCTLTSDGGTLYANGTTGAYTIPVSQGVTAYCDGTNCYAQTGSGGGGGGGGTILGSLQYAVGYYSAAGTASTINGTNVGLTGQVLTSVNASAPTFASPSLVDSACSPVTSASYPIACDSGTAIVDRAHTVLFQSGASAPTLPDSSLTGCAGMVVKLIDDGAGALVVGRSGSDTFIVINGTTKTDGATSFTLQNGDFATASQNASTSWEVTITQNQNLGTPTTLVLTNATGLPCAALPALTGDTTTSAGSCATTTAKINGGTFPTSADVIGSDGSAKPIAATPHGASHLLFCLDSSGSGTTQVCATTPTFSPGAGDMIIYKTTTTNTGSTTLNVNSAGAATIKKWQGTANLVAGDLLTGIYNFLIYDGTNWEIQTIGNAPGGTTALSAIVAATGTNSISNTTHGSQVWQWALTSNITAMKWGESSASSAGTIGNQYIGQFATATGSTAVPLNVTCSINSTATLPCLHVTPTWNGTGVNVGAIDVDITNTASGAGSLAIAARSSGTLEWGADIAGNTTQLGKVNATTALLSSLTASLPVCTDGSKNLATSCNNLVTATQLAAQYSKGSCTEVWGGSGSSFALTSGDDAISNNSCYNDSGVTRTITAVKCASDNGANTTTVNPTFGASGTGTTILSGALTCGNSNAMSSTGTVSNASWTTGAGINPAMSGTLTGTHIVMIVEFTF